MPILRTRIYIQARRGHFTARVVDGGNVIRRDCKGLVHPRTLAGDYHAIAGTLKSILRELRTPLMWLRKPIVLLHLVEPVEGGYTNIELRGFKEALEQAGAGVALLCDDRAPPATDHQLHDALKFF